MTPVTDRTYDPSDNLWCLVLEKAGGIIAYAEEKSVFQPFCREVGEALYKDFPESFEGDFMDAYAHPLNKMNYRDLNDSIREGKIIEIGDVMIIRSWEPDCPYMAEANELTEFARK